MRILVVAIALLAVGVQCSIEDLLKIDEHDPRCATLETACDDIWLASMCKKTKMCIPRWEVMPTREGNDTELCALCKKMVKEAEDTLLSNETQDELRQVLEGSCDILVPIPGLKQMCKKLMDMFMSELMDILISKMDPTQVCTVSGLCYTDAELIERVKVLAVKMEQRTRRDADCSSCSSSVTKAKSFTRFVPQDAVIKAFIQVCEKEFGKEDDKCQRFGQTYVAKFYQRFNTAESGKTCQFLNKCSGGVAMVQNGVKDTLECEFCEAMIHKLRAQFNNTSMKTQVKQTLLNFCKVTGKYEQECENEVNTNFDEAYDEIIKMLDPQGVCTLIGLCGTTTVRNTIPLARMTPALELESLPMAKLTRAIRRPGGVIRDTECEVCKLVVNELDSELTDQTTVNELKSILDSVCSEIPIVSNSVCVDFVNTNIDQFLKMITDRYTGDYVCSAILGVCPATKKTQVPKVSTETCELCEMGADWLLATLKDNKTEAAIISALDQVCSVIPVDAADCKNYINQYVDMIVHLISEDVTSEELCAALGLCPSTKAIIKPKKVGGNGCSICMLISGFVVDELKDGKTEAEILDGLEEVCKVIPVNAQECKNIIDTYGGIIITELVNNVTPDEICTTLGLCTSRRPAVKAKKVGDGCSTCMLFAGYIIDELKDNKTQAEILAGLEEVCKVIPINGQECKNFIDTYGEMLIQALANDISADEICQTFGLCASRRVGPKVKNLRDGCSTCIVVAGIILSELKDNKTKAEIISDLEEVCSVIPMDGQECKKFIDTYAEEIIDDLVNNFSAQSLCARLGLCVQRRPAPVKETKDAGTACTTCMLFAGFIVSELKDNKTEAEILSGLEEVCKIIPMDSNECKNYVDTYGGLLIQALANDISADEICSTLGLCATRRVKKVGDNCMLCQLVAGYLVDDLENNKTEAAIISALDKVCSKIPMDQTECQEYVSEYTDELFQLLKKDLTPNEICAALGLCSSATKVVKSVRGIECAACKDAVGWLINELVNNKTEAAIVAALDKVCYVIPMNRADCERYINTYGSIIINMIIEDMGAGEICSVIGLCSTQKIVKNVNLGDKCSICETVAQWLINQIKDNKTEAAIVAALDQVCSAIPIDQAECKSYVDQYAKELIELLAQDLDPEQICTSLGLCSIPRKAHKAPRDEECSICTDIAQYLLDTLEDNSTLEEIVAALDEVCSVIPIDSAECKQYVDQYAAEFIKSVAEGFTPDGLCRDLGLCPEAKKIRDSQNCQMCEFVVTLVEAELQNPHTQADIENVVAKACSLMPQKDQVVCRNMVNTYTGLIIEMIESMEGPDSICQLLTFCPTPPTNVKCEICTFVTNYVESELATNRTESAIQHFFDKACDMLPNMDVPQCKETVDQFADMMIQLFLQMVPPRKICEEIKLCPTSTAQNKKIVASPKVKDENCEFCKWLVQWVDTQLENPRTEEAIKSELDKACDLITDAAECKQMVNDYVDMIVKMLIQYADPEKICEATGKCPKKSTTVTTGKSDDSPCSYCTQITQWVIDQISDKRTEDEIKKQLDRVCTVLPIDKERCDNFVEEYTDIILQMILDRADSKKICEYIGLCPEKKVVKITSGSECSYCKTIMTFIADEIKDEDNQEEIVGVVERLCNYVPAEYVSDCKRMIEVEGTVIVRLIAQGIDPEGICELIKMCPTNGRNVVCTWCEYALHFLQNELYDNKTEGAIQEALERMCARLPSSIMVNDCKEFVDVYGPSIEVIIAQELDPSIVCVAVRACKTGHYEQLRRTPVTRRCDNCMHTLKSFKKDPKGMCSGANAQFKKNCETAVSTFGVALVEAFDSEHHLCKLATRCPKPLGKYECSRRCKYIPA